MESILLIVIFGGVSAYACLGTVLEARAFRKVAARTELAQIGRQLEGDYNGIPVTVAAEYRREHDHRNEWTIVEATLEADDEQAEQLLDDPQLEDALCECRGRVSALRVDHGRLRAEMPGAVVAAGQLIEVLDAVTECAAHLNSTHPAR